jgi:hypothetical protein
MAVWDDRVSSPIEGAFPLTSAKSKFLSLGAIPHLF